MREKEPLNISVLVTDGGGRMHEGFSDEVKKNASAVDAPEHMGANSLASFLT